VTIAPCTNRPLFQIALQVVGEGCRSLVAPFGFFLQRLQKDRIEVAAQQASQAPILGHDARWGRICIDDRVFHGAARVFGFAIGPLAAEKLVQHHSERIDVGGG
jgi:hypothetical protein